MTTQMLNCSLLPVVQELVQCGPFTQYEMQTSTKDSKLLNKKGPIGVAVNLSC